MTGKDLRIARLIYGYNTQQEVADALGVSLNTIQRCESLPEVDGKTLGQYTHGLGFDMYEMVQFFNQMRAQRKRTLDKREKIE